MFVCTVHSLVSSCHKMVVIPQPHFYILYIYIYIVSRLETSVRNSYTTAPYSGSISPTLLTLVLPLLDSPCSSSTRHLTRQRHRNHPAFLANGMIEIESLSRPGTKTRRVLRRDRSGRPCTFLQKALIPLAVVPVLLQCERYPT
jgi:hypothetical protein